MSWLIQNAPSAGLTLLNLLLASCALWAAITAKSCLKALHRKLEAPSIKSWQEFDAELSSQAAALSSVSKTVRRLSSRIGMQDVRERQKQGSAQLNLDGLSPAEKKAQLRRALASGKLRPIRDEDVVAGVDSSAPDA